MIELAAITLENEMDLTLAYKRSIRVCEVLGLTISTQTAFATAVSEVCREVIDKAVEGKAVLGAFQEDGRFLVGAQIRGHNSEPFERGAGGLEYARKLVPVLEFAQSATEVSITLKLGIPRTVRLDARKVAIVKEQLAKEGPISAYEEVKLRNAELHQLNEQKELALLQSNILNEQKNEFLSVVGHELNTPLTVLRSFTQLARRIEGGNHPAIGNYLGKIELQVGKLTSLVQQLLDSSKIENGKITYHLESTSFNVFVTDIVEGLIPTFPTHQLSLELAEDCEVEIDRLRIEQVINNLINNAAKYSKAGTHIIISTTVVNSLLMVSVKDEGIGMSEETIEQVFKKFYRSKDVSKRFSGLGMGLYIASRIVRDHDGEFLIDSQEGKGSKFSFSLAVN